MSERNTPRVHNKLKPQVYDFDIVNCPAAELFEKLSTSVKGLSSTEAAKRVEEYGYNEPSKKKKRTIVFEVISKFLNPLVIVLLVIGTFSFFASEDKTSSYIVFLLVLVSVSITFFQERKSNKEAEKLSELVRTNVTVFRNGKPVEVSIKELVPGDIVDLFAGDMIPADLRIISAKDLFVNQATLTGESMPVEKLSENKKQSGAVADAENLAFMGSSVVSGTALGVVLKTGSFTQFGNLAVRLSTMTVQTSFEKGVNRFVVVMIRAMVVLVISIFAINAFSKHDMVEAFLFAIAVAIGLAPEMLPLIVTLNLSKGAIAMSRKQVIVKRLNSIQNFGAMDVLCTDKTGTI